MSRNAFYTEEKSKLQNVITLRDLIAGQALHEDPCLLMAKQLMALRVLCRKLEQEAASLSRTLNDNFDIRVT